MRTSNSQLSLCRLRATGTSSSTPSRYSTRLGNWIEEGEQNGFLLVVAINDRKYFTHISRHLEGDLPDGVVGQIQRERLVPQFKRGNYGQGINDTIQAYVATSAAKRGFSIEGIDQVTLIKEPRQPRRTNRRRRSTTYPVVRS